MHQRWSRGRLVSIPSWKALDLKFEAHEYLLTSVEHREEVSTTCSSKQWHTRVAQRLSATISILQLWIPAVLTYDKLAAIYSLWDSARLQCVDLIRWYEIGGQCRDDIEVHDQEIVAYLQRMIRSQSYVLGRPLTTTKTIK
jgi:hypothetical protein